MAIDDIKPFFIACLFSVMATSSHAQNTAIDGAMECKVKSQQVQQIDEGRANTYSGFEGGLTIGSKIDFQYSQEDGTWEIALQPERQAKIFFDVFYRVTLLPRSRLDLSSGEFVVYEWMPDKKATIGNNTISYSDRKTHIIFKRYYKEDWHGVYSHLDYDLISWVFTMDCRHKTNRLEAAIKEAFSYTQ